MTGTPIYPLEDLGEKKLDLDGQVLGNGIIFAEK